MNSATRRTRACPVDALDEELKSALRHHGTKYGLEDLETDILMCCETITVHRKKGLAGGIRTTLSAVYVTPKWLVWAESSGRSEVAACSALLSQIEVGGPGAAAGYAIQDEQGLNITGRYTDKTRSGMAFIVLDGEADGLKFRRVLEEAMKRSRNVQKNSSAA